MIKIKSDKIICGQQIVSGYVYFENGKIADVTGKELPYEQEFNATGGEAILLLNRARCAAREAELRAVAAFTDRDGVPTRVDILQALTLYLFQARTLPTALLQAHQKWLTDKF